MSLPIPKLQLFGYRALVLLDSRIAPSSTLQLPEEVENIDRSRGIVVAVGDGKSEQDDSKPPKQFSFKVGDHVLLSEYAVMPYIEGDQIYRIVSGQDVIGILPPESIIEPSTLVCAPNF